MGGVESIPDDEMHLPYSERCCNWQGTYYDDTDDDDDSIVAVNHFEQEEKEEIRKGRQQQQQQQHDRDELLRHHRHQKQQQHQGQHSINGVTDDDDDDVRNSSSFDLREDSDYVYAEEAREECCSSPCSPIRLQQVPSWLHKREKYERSLVKYHRNKVKYLKKDIARRRRQVLEDQISFSTLFFACMTCNAFYTIDPSTEWIDPSSSGNAPKVTRPAQTSSGGGPIANKLR